MLACGPMSCDPRSPRGATATPSARRSPPPAPLQLRSSVAPGGHGVLAARRGCDPRSPRGATATSGCAASCRSAWTLRSSVAPGGDRHLASLADWDVRAYGCDPRSPRGATATVLSDEGLVVTSKLRSSVAPGGDRHASSAALLSVTSELRSSVAPGGDRHPRADDPRLRRQGVAILGRPGGRPPHGGMSTGGRTTSGCDPRSPRGATATRAPSLRSQPGFSVAILGRPGGRPPPQDALVHQSPPIVLRSSVAPGGDRHLEAAARQATSRDVAILGRPGGRPPPAGPRAVGPCASSCDPRSPRGATATAGVHRRAGPIGRLRSSVAPGGDRHACTVRDHPESTCVAILGRPGGRPPPGRVE